MKCLLSQLCLLLTLTTILFGNILTGFCLEKKIYPDLLKQWDQSGDFAPMFPFILEPKAGNNLTNVTTWPDNELQKNIDKRGLISVQNGVFKNAQGERACFLGTNICFSGCFPEHKDAELCAKMLARFGINIIRMHYVHHKNPANKKYSAPDSFIEPVQLEKFDYFINELKKNGIYTDLALNIGRKFGTESGFENADKLPWYNNGIDNIDQRMIDLHKKYVKDLLDHVNPYTGLSYREDPSVAFVEIANENSIVSSWYRSSMDDLPEPYAKNFKNQWNEFLTEKYHSTVSLQKAWGIEQGIDSAKNIIPDGFFSDDYNEKTAQNWGLQHDKKSKGTWSVVPTTSNDSIQGKRFSKLKIEKIGLTANIPQFFRRNLKVVKDQVYTISFKVKTDKKSQISIRMSQDHDPWRVVGVKTTLETSPQWEEKVFSFRAQENDDNVRIVFANFEPCEVYLADLCFHQGLDASAPELQESLEDKTIPVPRRNSLSFLKNRDKDLCEFLYKLENNYFQTLYQHLKKDVHCPHPISGTQITYGYRNVQGAFDYCDIHGYWNHPIFPNKKWDSKDWYLKNRALVNAPFNAHTMMRLGINRILGMPYTVSEYDHPYPNLYMAEGDLIYSSFGAFQNWDAIFQFAWTHSNKFFRNTVTPMFDLCSNQVKLVHLPACYAMFVRGDVKRGPGRFVHAPKLSLKDEIKLNAANSKFFQDLNGFQGDKSLSQVVYSGIDLGKDDTAPRAKKINSWLDLPRKMGHPEQKRLVNEFGEIIWDYQKEKAGFYQVDTPRTKILTGFVLGRTFRFKGISIKPEKTRADWLSLSLVQTDGQENKTTLGTGHWLLAATGQIYNTGAKITDLGDDRISVAEDYGGSNGSAPVLCEGIPAKITLANPDSKKIEAFALRPDGSRKNAIPVVIQEKSAVVNIDPKYKTLWYELVISN